MALAQYLHPDRVEICEQMSSKAVVLRRIAELLAGDMLDASEVEKVLLEREETQTTGVGSGIAVPHGRIPIDEIRAALLVVRSGVPFDAIDGQDVFIVLGLLAPAEQPTKLLRVLMEVSRVFRDDGTRGALVALDDANELIERLSR